MFGAIYGDVIGSYYELHTTKNYNFDFHSESTFTDDSLLTTAVCKAILNNPADITHFELKKRALEYAVQYKRYYSLFPNAGFGTMFSQWAKSSEIKVIHSYGNGAAMRVVPIGYAYNTLEQVMLQAKASCLYTHKNKEAITGAKAVAGTVFMARNGASKEEIRAFAGKLFRLELTTPLKQLKQNYSFDSRTSYSVPPAIIAFLESTDYESAIRNAVSLGGDADTIACIAGGIAEAFYRHIPDEIKNFCDTRLDYSIRSTVREFEEKYGK
jgi:ADP-ribosylglycohydrolase